MVSCLLYILVGLLFLLQNVIKAYITPVLIFGIKENRTRPVFPAMPQDEIRELITELYSQYSIVLFMEKNVRPMYSEGRLEGFPKSDIFTYYACVDLPEDAFDMSEVKALRADAAGHITGFQCESMGSQKLYPIITALSKNTVDLRAARVNSIKFLADELFKCTDPPLFVFVNDIRSGQDKCDVLNVTEAPPITTTTMNSFTTTISPPITTVATRLTFEFNVKNIATTLANKLKIVDVATQNSKFYNKIDEEPIKLTLNVEKKSDYYDVLEAIYDNEIYYGRRVKWREGKIFANKGVFFKKGQHILRVNDFQLDIGTDLPGQEIPRPEEDGEENVYVTPGILSGLFVFTLLGSITFWGITMIMDIGTNDQFDNPSMESYYTNVLRTEY